MDRHLCVCLLIVCCVSSEVLGAPGPLIVAKPNLVCPKTDLGNEKLQAQYDEMWATYSADVERVTKKLQAELEQQRKAAQDAGNLDLLIFWQEATNGFQQKGQLSWNDAEQRKNWGNKYGDSTFPEEFHVVIKKTVEDYPAAKEKLRAGYVDLEKAFTMAGDVPRALTMRSEFAHLGAPLSPTPATERRTSQQLAQNLRGTLWRNEGDFFFEWDATGRVWHYHKDNSGVRNPVQVTYTSGNACDVVLVAVNVKQKLVFEDDLKSFKQMSDDGKTVLKTAVRVH